MALRLNRMNSNVSFLGYSILKFEEKSGKNCYILAPHPERFWYKIICVILCVAIPRLDLSMMYLGKILY